ncbi:Chromosome partition protein Smc [Mycobacterium simulans]|uniref:Chromosome partition protein Smc n=1 Tax=Mycobacterium simulans TaxID=627089 RepID=A0A7Z7NB08_9MYCO|nr:hypothetical protein [Mycobacterium simulans]SOJ56412.1 Chromosome partition protein Smc [Mycobacterium simulans]
MTLDIAVRSQATGGLRLIPHIPPLRPCRLEGRNGIGKSAVIRLLLLASGVQPYVGEPEAWRSLKALVGSTSISISGLLGAHDSAQLILTPQRWPDEPVEMIGPWLGELTLDGAAAPVQQLFEILNVVHLVGTERLVDTLNHQRARFNMSLVQAKTRLQSLEERRAELGEIDEELAFVSPTGAALDAGNLADAKKERVRLEKSVSVAKRKVEELQHATGINAMLQAGTQSGRAEELAQLRTDLVDARAELAEHSIALDAAVKEMAKGTQKQRAIGKAEAKLSDAQHALEKSNNRQDELTGHLTALGIDGSQESLTDEELSPLVQKLATTRQHLADLQQQAMRNRRSEAENEILDELRVVTGRAHDRGLGGLILFRINDTDVSVDDVREALGAFQPGVAIDDDELARVTQDVQELEELNTLLAGRAELVTSVETARSELMNQQRGAKGQDNLGVRVTEARRLRDEATTRVREINNRIGALSQSGFGPADLDVAHSRVEEILREWEIELPELPDQLMQAQAFLSKIRERDQLLKTTVAELTERAAQRRIARDALRQKIRTKDSYRWLADLAAGLNHAKFTSSDSDWSEETWQGVSDHVTHARKTLFRLVADVEALQAVAATDAETGPFAGALRSLVEHDARDQLSTPSIAEALFDGGHVQRVDLEDQSVTWITRDGETRKRPLAAFSSGEQALGFMRARLQDVAAKPVQNRLVFLDEFGAFIAADRRKPLAELLTTDSVTALSDQVVVVLPLQADYSAELDETTGALHADFERRVAAVNDDGYFTEELQA